MNYNGIDISNCDGEIDFKKLKSTSVKNIIIKATEGVNFIDNKLEENYKNSKDLFKIGFYHFFSEKTSPKLQAKDFYTAIKEKKFDISPVLDIETNILNRSSKDISSRCLEFLKEFKLLSGLDCIIYTYRDFARNLLDNRVKNYKFWIAEYGKIKYTNDTGFKTIVGWQYSENGKLNGINSDCDLDIFTDEIYINKQKVLKEQTIKLNKLNRVSQHGVFTCTAYNLNIRSNPNLSSTVVGILNKGDKINYDSYIDSDGYRFISYIANSGNRRYIAERNLSNNKRFGTCV